MTQTAITSTTQDFLDIHDITNDLVIMKDGSAAVILAVSAMNFSLLAEEEQDAVIYAYAALLNSLNFQIQINIQSKTKDATTYLELLKKREDTVASTEKRKQIARYREFVGQLIQERNVLDKKFYVVIPAAALELGIISPQSILPGSAKFDISTIEKSVLLEKANGVLSPRADHLIGQFNRIGLYARKLATQEIIQNFYTNYNPEAVEGQQITDSDDYTTPLVQASMFSASLQNRSQVIKQFSQNPASSLSEVVPAAAAAVSPAPTLAPTPAPTPMPAEPDHKPEVVFEAPTLVPPPISSPTPAPITTPAPEAIPTPDLASYSSVSAPTQSGPSPATIQAPPLASATPQTPPQTQSAYSLPPLPEIS